MGKFIVVPIQQECAMSRLILVCLIFISSLSAKEYFGGEIKVSDTNKASFTLYAQNDDYFLQVFFKESSVKCDFKVRKISAPAWLKGRNGVIQADETGCSFQLKNKTLENFWNDVVTIDMAYYFTDKSNLRADVTINSLKKTTKAAAYFTLKPQE